jgi:exopolysaccharide production protein ExoY
MFGRQPRPLGGHPKRVLDVTVAAIALFLVFPLFVLTFLLLRLFDRGPVFFVQDRVGLGGERFPCIKFRTMAVDSDQRLKQHLAGNPEAAREWRETRKLMCDPRVTWIGHILRKTSIDELPQLINVLRGEMSCVGPRPVVEEELKQYGRFTAHYFSTRPGLTGLWQVSGRNRLSYPERVALDRSYVENWSLAMDLKILAMTIPAVVRVSNTA